MDSTSAFHARWCRSNLTAPVLMIHSNVFSQGLHNKSFKASVVDIAPWPACPADPGG